ncbi:MAG: DNA-directed RNA polymerase subunit P [Candidatus Hydrothermarchaeales archaeon]
MANKSSSLKYRCGNCNREVGLSDGELIRCPFCGHKILFKERSKVAKTTNAR